MEDIRRGCVGSGIEGIDGCPFKPAHDYLLKLVDAEELSEDEVLQVFDYHHPNNWTKTANPSEYRRNPVKFWQEYQNSNLQLTCGACHALRTITNEEHISRLRNEE